MINQGIKNNGVNGTGTNSCEGIVPGMDGISTVKVSKILSLIKTEKITETNSVLPTAGNIFAETVSYKKKEMTGNRN